MHCPLLTDSAVIDGLARARRPTLLVGGAADSAWRAQAIPANAELDALELPGVDHAVQVRGDPLASLDALRQTAERVGRLATRV